MSSRQVFSNDMCVHTWAQQRLASGRNAKQSISFAGPLLYSYSTVIANFAAHDFVLIMDSYSSVTTTHHLSIAGQAATGRTVVRVDVPRPQSADDHFINLNGMLTRMVEADGKLSRARSPSMRQVHAMTFACIHGDFERYAAQFGLDVPPLPHGGAELAAYSATLAARRLDARRLDQEAQIARQAEVDAAWRAGQPERDAEKARRSLELDRSNRALREEWIAGGLTHLSRAPGSIMLRIHPSKADTLQTSWGAECPLASALRVFRMARMVREGGRTIDFGRVVLGEFRLDHITLDGSVVAGCHTIGWDECERMASSIGEYP